MHAAPSMLLAVGCGLWAGPPGLDAAAGEPAAIVGGEASGPCEWPSVVALHTGGLCTATLVHPRVIVYAAHCGTLHSEVLFGEDVDAPARSVALLRCRRFTDLFAVSAGDYAWCELAEPVTDVPITPLLTGCDAELIAVGTPVTIVGFGDTNPDPNGPASTGHKHAAETTIVASLSLATIGGMGIGADSGDSGGPALVQLPDGSWRVLGLVSGGGGDGEAVKYVPAPTVIPWIEDRSGVDISPCHRVDEQGSSWAPTPACAGFFLANDPDTDWAQGCAGPVSAPSDRCGPPWTTIDDTAPPTVAFVSPEDGALFATAPVTVEVEAVAEDAGLGVREVELRVDGQPWLDPWGRAAHDEVPPYRFADLTLEAGPHTLTLVARDHAGFEAATSVIVQVGEDGSDSSDSSDSSDTIGGSDGPGGSDDASGSDDGQASCACAAEPDAPPPTLPAMLLTMLAAGLSRRRRANPAAAPRRAPTDPRSRWGRRA